MARNNSLLGLINQYIGVNDISLAKWELVVTTDYGTLRGSYSPPPVRANVQLMQLPNIQIDVDMVSFYRDTVIPENAALIQAKPMDEGGGEAAAENPIRERRRPI